MKSFALRTAILALAIASANAAAAQDLKVGDRVAMPNGNSWLDAVIIAVDPSRPYPYRVHPLGYLDTMDQSFSASMLKASGSVKTTAIGGIVNDPYLLAAKGQKAFHPTKIHAGAYECYALSSGGLEAAGILNFVILDDRRYRDVSGNAGAYNFDSSSTSLIFQDGTLKGLRAKYEQVSDPPVKTQPPTVTFEKSGDSCDLVLR